MSFSCVCESLSFLCSTRFLYVASCLQWHSEDHAWQVARARVGAFTLHCAGNARKKKVAHMWDSLVRVLALTLEARRVGEGLWARPPVQSPVPHQAYVKNPIRLWTASCLALNNATFASIVEVTSRSSAPCAPVKTTLQKCCDANLSFEIAKAHCLGPALLTVRQRQQQAAENLCEHGCQIVVSRQEPLRLCEVALHAFHLDARITLTVEFHLDGCSRSGILQ